LAIRLEISVDDKGTPTIKRFVDTSEKGAKKVKKSWLDSNNAVLKSFKGLLPALGAAAVAKGLTSVIGKCVSLASVAEETQAKFNTVFGNLSKSTNQWAENFGSSVGRSRTDVKGWMATLADTFKPLGFTVTKSADLSKKLTKLAVDVASFNNKMDADVLRDFQSALVGNHETVRKYGIIITEAQLKQEAHRLGLAKGRKELTALEKVQARYSLILKGSTDAQGDAIRTQGSYANQMKALRANLTNLGETLGELVLPFMTSLVKSTNEATKSISALSEVIQEGIFFEMIFSKPAIKQMKDTFLGILSGKSAVEAAGIAAANTTLAWAKWRKEIEKARKELAKSGKDGKEPPPPPDSEIFIPIPFEEIEKYSKEAFEGRLAMANHLWEKELAIHQAKVEFDKEHEEKKKQWAENEKKRLESIREEMKRNQEVQRQWMDFAINTQEQLIGLMQSFRSDVEWFKSQNPRDWKFWDFLEFQERFESKKRSILGMIMPFIGAKWGGEIGYQGGGDVIRGIPLPPAVRARTGEDVIIMAQRGEKIIPKGQAGGTVININITAQSVDETFVRNKLVPVLKRLKYDERVIF
jgi:hypothetical protein